MPVTSKKQGKFMQAVANNPKFAKKVGVKQSIGREFTKEKSMKTKKMNMGGMADREGRAMAAGRLAGRPGMMADARGRAMMKKGGKVKKMNKGGRTDRTKSIMNEKDEIRRVDREIRDNEGYMKGGKVGYAAGGMATGVVAKKAAKGLKKMIQKAKSIDSVNKYNCADLLEWKPNLKKDVVHSMEVLYYFKKPIEVLKNIYKNWLNDNGRLIIGIDFYFENTTSHSWPEKTNVSIMTLLKTKEWEGLLIEAGFKNVKSWTVGETENWNGTLVLSGTKN